MGAWIEILPICITSCGVRLVAPLVGAWIEIFFVVRLKSAIIVAPLVGAWIEMIV